MTENTLARHRRPILPATFRSETLRRWYREWDRWSAAPETQASVARWRAASVSMRQLTTVDEVVAGCGRGGAIPAQLANTRLLHLVTAATNGDRDAGRVVLVRILPGLVTLADRRAHAGERGFDELLEEYLAAGWLATAGYPVARRPAKVAANLLLDTENQLYGRKPLIDRRTFPRRPEALDCPPARPDGRSVDAPDEPLLTLLDLLAEATAAGLSPTSRETLTDLGVVGLSPLEIAAREGVTDRAVRLRRRRAIGELRACLDLGAEPRRPARAGGATSEPVVDARVA